MGELQLIDQTQVELIAKAVEDLAASSNLVNMDGLDWNGRASIRSIGEKTQIVIPWFAVLLSDDNQVVIFCLSVSPERVSFEWQNIDDAIDRISKRLITCLPQLAADSNQIRSAARKQSIEFMGLDVKDSIQLGDRIEYIHHWEQDTRQKKISFMVGDDCHQLTQYEYMMQGWVKI
jgi:hypothetical protein